MKAKEKAKELVDKIYYDIDFDLVGMPNTKKMVAKQCSIILVNEVLRVLENELLELYGQARTCDINKNMQNYYLKVKEELEKLPA